MLKKTCKVEVERIICADRHWTGYVTRTGELQLNELLTAEGNI